MKAIVCAMGAVVLISGCGLTGLGGNAMRPNSPPTDPGLALCTTGGGAILQIDSPTGPTATCKMPDGRLLKLNELKGAAS
ncbi:MAG: hypothetical protein DI498_11250 [Paracoccus denitrificans]|nr:MAG: hypothetical protein DI498_11250 [Paracoccus denitrificans]PZO83564.1 MAG: hypothetical protein DI633_11250 [Paracoccus denitrificans]